MRSLLKTRFCLHSTGSLTRRKEFSLVQSSGSLKRRLMLIRLSVAAMILPVRKMAAKKTTTTSSTTKPQGLSLTI